ncbi:MAG TPA: M23 family metallopeptidase [Qipengyuania sp.]|nr:M23 family metallopeptidase [Qipengyuania sp.]
MNRLALGDRLRIIATTAAVTAVVTSVGWIAFGGGIMSTVGNLAVVRKVEPVVAAPSPNDAAGGPAAAVGRVRATVPRTATAISGVYVLPVAGVRPEQLTDTFSDARGGGARVHDAIDIMAPRGTPVVAAVEGTVEKLFTSKAGGLTVYVRSPDRRTITYYAHLDAYVEGLREGQVLSAGEQIGTVGSTGNADPAAPHLHFAIMQTTPDADWWEPATAINPYPILRGRR